METMIAYCGLDCMQCEAYKATQAHDETAKDIIAAKWQKAFNSPNITAAFVTCEGCLNNKGHLGGHCLECDIRACGISHGVANCGYCAEMHQCDKISGVFSMAPEAKAVLETIQARAFPG